MWWGADPNGPMPFPPGPGPMGGAPPTVLVSCCDICAREEMGSKEEVAGPMGPLGPWLGLIGMLSGLFILHAPGNGPGKLVLLGPPDNVVSVLDAIVSSECELVVTLQLLLAVEEGAYGP